MAIRRITISVPAQTAKKIKKAAGKVPVSAWVTELIEEKLEDEELELKWQEFYDSVNPTTKDKKRAQAMLARLSKSSRRKGAA